MLRKNRQETQTLQSSEHKIYCKVIQRCAWGGKQKYWRKIPDIFISRFCEDDCG